MLQGLGQGLLFVAMDADRTSDGQPLGDAIEALGDLAGSLFGDRVERFAGLLAAVGAERGEVAEQGVGEHQEAEADVRLLTEVTRLHEHVGQGGGQRRVGVVGIAPGQAVGQVVALAAGVLLHDLAQIPAVAREGIGHHLVESAALPVGEDEDHREAGDQGAEQGVHQARQEQAVAVADLVEAEQHQQGDSGRGQGVAGGAGGEEHHPGNHGESRLQEGAGEQVE
ncbi:hypothetical protein D9M71_569910 [compost metagenome]